MSRVITETEAKILNKIAEITETASVGPDTLLKDLDGWDSMAALSYVMYASDLGAPFKDVKPISEAKTAGDLCRLITGRLPDKK